MRRHERHERADLQSGKGHKDENFPVASFLIAPKHRPPVLAFYRFVRAADDVADHPTAPPRAEAGFAGADARQPDGRERCGGAKGVTLRRVLAEQQLAPDHALDLLEAFRRDVTKLRYRDWDDLIDYCRYSAMPVGRFVLDVHGESRDSWPANDALCAALQIINHLQDCAKDYRRTGPGLYSGRCPGRGRDRRHGPGRAPAPARRCKRRDRRPGGEKRRIAGQSRAFAGQIRDGRLALEVDLIQTLAEDLNQTLTRRDPLSEKVHHSKLDVAALFVKRFPAFAFSSPETQDHEYDRDAWTRRRPRRRRKRPAAVLSIWPCG